MVTLSTLTLGPWWSDDSQPCHNPPVHRLLGTLLLVMSTGLFFLVRRISRPQSYETRSHGDLTVTQFILGVATLLLHT